MRKWIKLIKFIKKHRKENMLPHFTILSNDREIIVTAEAEGVNEEIRINYK